MDKILLDEINFVVPDNERISFDLASIYDSLEDDINSNKALIWIDEFVRKIEKGSVGFVFGQGQRFFRQSKLTLHYREMNGFIRQYSEEKVYCPHVQVFFDVCIVKRKLNPGSFPSEYSKFHNTKIKGWELFNQIVEEIRNIVSSKEFKKKIYSKTESFKKGFSSSAKYVNKLFDRYARLLIIRIDLSFAQKGVECPEKNDLRFAKSSFARFLNNRRSRSISNGELGYIWRLEYGKKKGFHYHLFFFFDGSKRQKDAHLAHEIGKYWKTVTAGVGSYHNCNAHKKEYKRLAIGMASYDDPLRRSVILQVLSYMHKQEQTLTEKIFKKSRTWGRGVPPKINKSVGGRPRINVT